MGLLGVSLLVASVVYVLIRPPAWLALRFPSPGRHARPPTSTTSVSDKTRRRGGGHDVVDDEPAPGPPKREPPWEEDASVSSDRPSLSSAATPPTLRRTSIAVRDADDDGLMTPKASAVTPSPAVPTFSLSDDADSPPSPSRPDFSSMLPPPIPARRTAPSAGRLPILPAFPALDSAQRARGPVPHRGPPNPSPSSASALAPPPTHSARPPKPSRKVTLEPGHSPLDWARISGPNADLRGIHPPSASYLRVTPSMLRSQTGRKGKDAWMAINGRVYNITPYAAYHPGGIPELMRGAARDGTKLFGEVHPWVNYEAMLSACLIGLLVDEPEGAASHESEMDQMD
ncbi:hypothetical protein E4U42_001994 [Claviceps africana]|uniref:Cytochrome b5 heme-binding domain-containing protein n=1 Tax=Claviceps africana TaxID=83212 RepID=A0A8K0JB86_9HYPO|nr:hypothetical protein E4U42_001994 [Claviceps africana]